MVLLGYLVSSIPAFSVGRSCHHSSSLPYRCMSSTRTRTTRPRTTGTILAVSNQPTTSLFHKQRRRPLVLHAELVTEAEDSTNSNNNKGAEDRSQKRHLKREDRIAFLQDRAQHGDRTTTSSTPMSLSSSSMLSQSEQKELQGLLATNFVEQYSSDNFSQDHRDFKDGHNQVFLKLCLYCQRASGGRGRGRGRRTDSDGSVTEPETKINVFYLDGPCGRTTQTLLSTLDASQCYTANRHASTCEALMMHTAASNTTLDKTQTMMTAHQQEQERGRSKIHIAHASAAHALRTIFRDVTFHAYYFDGCGGYTPQIMDMIQASIFHNHHIEQDDNDDQHHPSSTSSKFLLSTPIAIGFSILGGGRDCMDKEQDIMQSLVKLVKPLGCRVHRVGDDPLFYGVEEERWLQKVESMTMTTWCMIERA
jgi:hypothetical protein